MANEQIAKVESLTLDDGRRAERHVTHDDTGKEVVEIFAEEKRPLKLEKRIVREFKSVVAKEVHQTVRDGEVAYEEVLSGEPDVPLQIRSRLGTPDHSKVIDGDYVRREEIDRLIADGVVAGVSALVERMEPAGTPKISAQEVVENAVADKSSRDMTINIILGAVIFVQLGVFAYMFLL